MEKYNNDGLTSGGIIIKQETMKKLLETEVKAEGLKEVSREIIDGNLVVVLEGEKKTLRDYINDAGYIYGDEISQLDFITCCGTMKAICDDLNHGRKGSNYSIINDGNGYISQYIMDRFFKTIFGFWSSAAAEKAIEICGDEFLDKLFGV